MLDYPLKKGFRIVNVPNLRFPEFTGEWKETTLGKCAVDSLDYGMNAAAIDYDGKNKYIRITDIDENSSRYISTNPVSPAGELSDKYIVEPDDILFARTGASTGKTYLYNKEDGKLYFAGFLIRARIKPEYNSAFIFAQTQTAQYHKWVQLMSIRSGQPGINSQEYASYKFLVPKKDEQNKIAVLLSHIDDRIATQSQIIKELETLMKGLCDNIFSQRLRFNGVEDEWQEKTLGNVLTEPIQAAVNHPDKIELLTVKLYCKGIENTGKYPTTTPNGRPYYRRFKNEILIGKQNFHNGGIGIVKEDNDGKICSNAISSYCVLNDNLHFVYYYISRPAYYLKVGDLIGGTGQKEISKAMLLRLGIMMPSQEEQTQVANFISAIDEKLETERQILKAYCDQKKYLLANMFI